MKPTKPRAVRRRLTKAQLLPLPTRDVQRLSLKHHLALAALLTGRADVDSIATLLNVVYLAFFLRNPDDVEPSRYREAEDVLNAIVARMQRGECERPSEHERTVLEQVVIEHDAQMATVAKYRLVDAWSRLAHVIKLGSVSPIPAGE
ncbi:hypothetical protein [Burkholderia territorii]|uniref:hypothetical protein n=1 Tax=Burkholderia territorii TaxID=1503055 RepID=UPI0009BE2462|nr:hypothetical protein [Burkholderia territorii]